MFNFNRFKIRGGVHTQERKEISVGSPIRSLGIPPELYLPLRQHAGKAAVPVVEVGERVLKGQLLATRSSEVCASIHAPTSGTITSISGIVAPHPSMLTTQAITLTPDFLDAAAEPVIPADPMQLSPAEIADRIDSAGIVGLGGATFPAALKLKSGFKNDVEALILNGGECEPYLTCDDRLMREQAENILKGARLLQRAVNARHILVGIEDNKPEAIAAMEAAAKGKFDIKVISMPARYPMGASRQIIQATTGTEIPAGVRTSEMGYLLYNVATAYAVYKALYVGEPLLTRVVTVSGLCVKQPQNVEVMLGSPISWVLKQCGGLVDDPVRTIMGGPMMGLLLQTTETPITKGANGVLALSDSEISHGQSAACIRCGSCVDACPMGLLPLEMARHSRSDDVDGAVEYGLKDCILCGSCAYVCPSHIPLVHYFQFAKGELSSQRQQSRKTELTKQLTAERDARLQREAEAKAAAKAAKEAAKAARAKAKAEAKAKKEAAAAAKSETQSTDEES